MPRAGYLKLAGTPGPKGDSLGQGQSSETGPERVARGGRKPSPRLPVCRASGGHAYAHEAKSDVSIWPRGCKSGEEQQYLVPAPLGGQRLLQGWWSPEAWQSPRVWGELASFVSS